MAILALVSSAANRSLAEEFTYDSPMFADPELLPAETVNSFAPELKSLWIEALRRPEVELRRQAADAIVETHQLGMAGLEETIPELIKLLEQPNQHPLVVLTAVRALIELDASLSASAFEKLLAGGDIKLAQVIEPALAKWNPERLQQIWLARLSEPTAPRGLKILACQGIAAVQRSEAAASLREIVASPATDSGLRLEAARALGAVQTTGLEEIARSLASKKSSREIPDRLVAASLLLRHESSAASTLLTELAKDSEPSVAAIAIQALAAQKNTLVLSIAEQSLQHSDAGVRRASIEALASFPAPERLKLLAERLDDPHPHNRVAIREILHSQHQDATFSELVKELTASALATESWRAQEQAALLAGLIDHEPTSDRLVVLLNSPRPEVFVAASWALRKLSIPATAPMIQAKLQIEGAKIAALASGKTLPKGETGVDSQVFKRAQDIQFSQLIQALGEFKYAPADAVCRVCVSRTPLLGKETRVAAIWTLGHLHAGKPDEELASKLVGRLTDVESNIPEDVRVRRMAAVSLGRMKAESALKDLRRFDREPSTAGAACVWAIHEITGESLPPIGPVIVPRTGWFLEPIPEQAADQTNPDFPKKTETGGQ